MRFDLHPSIVSVTVRLRWMSYRRGNLQSSLRTFAAFAWILGPSIIPSTLKKKAFPQHDASIAMFHSKGFQSVFSVICTVSFPPHIWVGVGWLSQLAFLQELLNLT